MGLDMFLEKVTRVDAQYDFMQVELSIDLKIMGKKVNINTRRVSTIAEQVGYWRKSNQIHNWFVNNVQDGNDNCQQYEVSVEQLKTLLDLCRQVMDDHSKAADLLPAVDGFFFGSTEYDEYYFQDIENTIRIIAGVIAEIDQLPPGVHSYFQYQSSW